VRGLLDEQVASCKYTLDFSFSVNKMVMAHVNIAAKENVINYQFIRSEL